jgi:Histone chaperone Rttp106-like
VHLLDQEETKEHEFSMIDQADFAGIDAYIKRHGLQDASLAESRKAKKLKLNGTVRGEDKENGEGEEQSELQKAQQDIEDAEDEEEEDYDPGSEGFSDGSGDSSEEEEYEDEKSAGGNQNLVTDELGSEAEDVAPDPNDDDQL